MRAFYDGFALPVKKTVRHYYLADILFKVKEFEKDYISYLNGKHREALDSLKSGKLTDEAIAVLESAATEISAKY